MRLKETLNEINDLDIKEGEYEIPFAKREKYRKLNPKSNRMKNFKKVRYFKTDIAPKDRTFKNLPRYADKTPKCRFQDWFQLKGGSDTGPMGCDGKFYGWSHRAVYGFSVGEVIKPGTIGNKYEYTKEVQDKYNKLYDEDIKNGTRTGDEYLAVIKKFEPYTIKTAAEAKEHAIRFAKDVS